MSSKNINNDRSVIFALSFALFSVVLALLAAVMIFISVFVYEHIAQSEQAMNNIIDADISQTYPTVIIDAGHGGEDGGAIGTNGAVEKALNLEISFMLCDMLRASGMNVIMTRTEDILLYDRNADYMGHKKSLDLRARLEIAKSNPDSIFVSIHMNAFPSEKYSGLQVWYSKNNSGSKVLADMLQSYVSNKLQPENGRKIKQANSSIYLLDRAVSTAVLVECGFLSNSAECEKLSDGNYRRQLAFTLFAAIKEYIGNTDI
ncbi:MAG: N-acetylmuramoyl-L-alanine amidase [Clostridia bacterium]|nr:N-acetylmuramoyl-L-alanine amidase [Clostridia bacterium]